jgi:hypothetical protein
MRTPTETPLSLEKALSRASTFNIRNEKQNGHAKHRQGKP